jgi:hypothetical protein
MNKDCPFKVEVQDFYDAGTQQDAGDTFETALAIEKGKPYPNNAVMMNDPGDVYKINTAKGESIAFMVMPESQKAGLRAIVFDDLHVQLAEGRSPNEGAGFRMNALANGPVTFIRVQRPYNDSPPTKYALNFESAAPTEGGGTPSPAATPAAPTPTPIAATTPPPAPAPQVVEKVVEKMVEKPVGFKWLSGRGLKGLGIAFGVGLLAGLIGGFMLFGKKKQAS